MVTPPGETIPGPGTPGTPGPGGPSGDAEQPPSPIYEGTLTIRDDRDITELAKYDTITGSLVIATNAIATLDLSSVKTIGGDLVVSSPNGLTELTLSALGEVKGAVKIGASTKLTTVKLPALAKIGAGLTVSENADLVELQLPKLALVDGASTIDHNAVLPALSLLKLAQANLSVHNNEKLQTLTLGLNHRLSDLTVKANDALQTVLLPDAITLGKVAIDGAQSDAQKARLLSTVSAPKLTTLGRFSLVKTALGALSLNQLVSADELEIRGDPLQKLDLSALKEVNGLSVKISGPLALPSLTGAMKQQFAATSLDIIAATLDAPLLSSANALHLTLTQTQEFLLPALTSVSSLSFLSCPALRKVDLSRLLELDGVSLWATPLLSDLRFGSPKRLSLELRETGLSVLALPGLSELHHLIIQGNKALTSVDLRNVASATGISIGSSVSSDINPLLQTVRLDALSTVEYGMSVVGSKALTTLALGNLKAIGRWFHVTGFHGTVLDVGKLQSADEVTIEYTDAVVIALQSLQTVTSFLRLYQNSAVTALKLLQLDSAGTVEITNNALLSSLNADALSQVSYLTVGSNRELLSIAFSTLAKATYVKVSGNIKLPQCEVDALKTQLENSGFTGTFLSSGNLSGASCR